MRSGLQVFGVLAGLAMCAGTVLADGTLQWVGSGPGNANGGGIFTFKMVSDAAGGNAYSTGGWAGEQGEDGIGSQWQTFCIETLEHISGTCYRGVTGTTVVSGTADPARFTGGDVMPSLAFRQTLQPQTAFLYSGFRAGSLASVSGCGSNNPASVSGTEANALQAAIWYSQGQVGSNWISTSYTSTTVTLINNLLAYANANSSSAYWVAGGNVRVMNTFTGSAGNWTNAQSQLMLLPLPAETTMAGIGLMGLIGVRAVRRRRS